MVMESMTGVVVTPQYKNTQSVTVSNNIKVPKKKIQEFGVIEQAAVASLIKLGYNKAKAVECVRKVQDLNVVNPDDFYKVCILEIMK